MLFRILSFSDTPLGSQTGVITFVCGHSLMVNDILSLYIEAVITLLLFTIG